MAVEQVLDRILDRAIVPGYSAIGYAVRRRQWTDGDPAPGSLRGKRAVVTGAGSGLGTATARMLAELGAEVVLMVRDAGRAQAALAEVSAARATGAPEPVIELCDVSSLAAVEQCAARLLADGRPIDILVHNAGVLPPERTESVDGHELTVATHVLGPVLLTERIRSLLRGGRVIFVASGGMYTQKLPAEDPEFREGRYQGAVAYARSKRMQVVLTPILAERWRSEGIDVQVMHPGWADTPGVASSLPLFRLLTKPVLRDAEAGADTIVWLAATQPAPPSGRFWHDRVDRPTNYRQGTEESAAERERFWAWVRSTLELD